MTLVEAISARNSAAKTIYGKLFNWIVGKVNASILQKMKEMGHTGEAEDGGAVVAKMGLLDIFGFECFETNSFE